MPSRTFFRRFSSLLIIFALLFANSGLPVRAQEPPPPAKRDLIEVPPPPGGSVDTDPALVEAVEKAIAEQRGQAPSTAVIVSNVQQLDGWAFGTAAIQAPDTGNVGPDGMLFLARQTPNGWQAAIQHTPAFMSWLITAPARLVPDSARRLLLANRLTGIGSAQLSLPWAAGQTWTFTGGPHSNDGSGVHPWTALDFAVGGGNGQVRAARDGIAYLDCANFVRIDHADGWQTGYYHLTNIAVTNGQTVARGTLLGTTSTAIGCGGSATGPHVHFSLRLNGVQQEIMGHDIGGWTVLNTTTQYSGCLQKGNVTRCTPSGQIYNDGTIGSGTPPATCPQSGGVILYRNANYDCGGQGDGSGYVLKNSSGFQNLPNGLNDQASSIRIPSGWSVRLFENADRGGGQICFNATGDSDFSNDAFNNGLGVNDKTSSFEVFTSADCSTSTPDTTPPSGDYTSPANNATVGRTVQLSASASDNAGGSGVKEVHFTAKWNNQWQLVYNDTNAPYDYAWDLCASGVPDGDIELGLDVYDNAGNIFSVSSVHPNLHITKSYSCAPTSATWSADYWMNKYLAGYVNYHADESGTYLFRDWGDGGPGGGIPVDEWSARYTRTAYFPGGDYRFHCQHDDGCRLYVDGQNRIDAWWDSLFSSNDWGGYLSPGTHEVKVEFYDNQGSARLEAWWQGPGFLPRDQDCDPNQWCGEYWGNRDLAGTPAIRRNEGDLLDHDWGSGGPDPTFLIDSFSSRFTRNADFACGTYRFHLFGDEGVRLWIDVASQIDQWHDQTAWFQTDVSLTSGSHTLKVEHYENGGGAGVKLWWEKLSDCALSVSVESVSQHYVQPNELFEPSVRVRVNSSYLDPARGDHLYNVGGGSFNAWPVQAVKTYVSEGNAYTFDVNNDRSFRMTAPASEGVYTSRWQIKVNGNLIGPEAALQIIVDSTAPNVAVTSPALGSYLNANAVTIQANPQDAGSGIDQMQFFAGYDDGTGWGWRNLGWDTDGADGWGMSWDTSGVADQTDLAVYAFAWDRAGNGAGAANWALALDRVAPTTSMETLAAQQDSTAFIVRWNRADNLSGIDYVDLQVQPDGGAWQDWVTVTGEQYIGKWFYGELGHTYAFRMRGVDRAGNVEPYPVDAEANTTINPCSGDAYEPDSSSAAARTISVDAPAETHTFCGAGDEDWLKFWAQAGQSYMIYTSDLGETTDTVLTLYADDGATVIAENDDIVLGETLASWISWTAPTDGWRYVRARSWNARVAGSSVTYRLRVQTDYKAYLPLVGK